MNPFEKAKQREKQAEKQETNSSTNTEQPSNKLRNPFTGKNSAGPSPVKVRNPFTSKPADGAGSLPTPAASTAAASPKIGKPPGADTPREAAASSSPEREITAEEYVHESQPVAYTQDQMDKLQLCLAQLEQSFTHGKDKIGDAIRLVGQQLKETPELSKIMKPEDWGLMISGLRESYATTIVKKSERRGKASKRAENEAEAAAVLASIGFDF